MLSSWGKFKWKGRLSGGLDPTTVMTGTCLREVNPMALSPNWLS